MKYLIYFLIINAASLSAFGAEKTIQYFSGIIQVSSLDETIPYAPPYPSLVRRIVDFDNGKIEECVFQKEKVFSTDLIRTENALVFSAKDSDEAFTGTLTFADESLSSWSYELQVLKPNVGHITGELPDNGAKTDVVSGKMTIRKIWNAETLILEKYEMISKDRYLEALKTFASTNPIPAACQY